MLRTNAPDTSAHAEVFLQYDALLPVDCGRAYRARACGGEARDGTNRWHGWIEFVPQGEGSLVCTARETTQPDRTCTVYWSTGFDPGVPGRGARARAQSGANPRVTAAGAIRMRIQANDFADVRVADAG